VLETADGVRSQVATRKLHIVAAFVSLGPRLVAYAKQFIGVPYVYGGDGPSSFDCSGFTLWVYAHFGYQLPRTSWDQMAEGVPVKGPLRLGDLVFWDAGGHVGIYTGDDTFISATVHRGIWIYSFQVWSQTQSFTTARRILGTAPIRVFPALAGLRNGGPADATAPTSAW
jgi:cell wall-associated NlpC family hydrolase